MVPMVEEYTALLYYPKIQVDKAYFRAANAPTLLKKLMRDGRAMDIRKKVDIFALSIYGLVNFSKALGHIKDAISELFDRLDKRVTHVPAILAETFKSLNACRKKGE
ncbi:hypothetical protein Golob_024252 [Gossypium lobatum]|uniref:Uncharacterized protein n=1 Tax=Gossypium lobatum TaxID=34289 RepID=A0A7J8NCP6_9ROSI|nr:hypothetical protein [Gossypium lobatum]